MIAVVMVPMAIVVVFRDAVGGTAFVSAVLTVLVVMTIVERDMAIVHFRGLDTLYHVVIVAFVVVVHMTFVVAGRMSTFAAVLVVVLGMDGVVAMIGVGKTHCGDKHTGTKY